MSEEHSHVVVGFDFSHSAYEALDRAIRVSSRAPWHVLHFVAVIDPHSAFPALPAKHVDMAYADRVAAAVSSVVEANLKERLIADRVQFFVHAHIGKAAAEILRVAEDVGADLIIVGSRGLTGLERFLLGSVSEKVAREAGCSVEVVRPKRYAYVPLLEIVDKTDHEAYAEPHRYTYEDRRVSRRPNDWPLY